MAVTLLEEAKRILKSYPGAAVRLPDRWDPFWYIELCEKAGRMAAYDPMQAAREIQRAEWQLLFHHCASIK